MLLDDETIPENEAPLETQEDASDILAPFEEESAPSEVNQASSPKDQSDEALLTLDEIDSLLGPSPVDEMGGLRAILNSDMVYYERLPMLEVVFDRLVRLMSASLRNFTSDNVDVVLGSINTVRFGDYLNSIEQPAMINVFIGEEWDNSGLVTFDNDLIYSAVDVLLGGRRGVAPVHRENRPYTTIERSLLERLIHVVLNDLSAAFNPLSPITFRFERQETNVHFVGIVRPSNAAVVARLIVHIDDRNGHIDLVLPYATLEPIREILLQTFMGEKFGRDTIWENHLAGQLWHTEMHLDALLDQFTGKLQDVLDWKVGSQILLNATPQSPVQLNCGSYPMFIGYMGRKSGHIAVQIDNVLLAHKEDNA